MKFTLFATALFLGGVILQSEEIQIAVSSDPVLPVPNILEEKAKITADLKGWSIPEKSKGKVSAEEDSSFGGTVLKLKDHGSVYRTLDASMFQIGKSYIASCMICPDANVTTNNSGPSGLGISLNFWSKDWKTAGGMIAVGAGAKKWNKITSKPFLMPEWRMNCQLTPALRYTNGEGSVADIRVQEAFARMTVSVTAPEAIRQVKVMNDAGVAVFDSGILENGEKVFRKEIQIETPYTYSVMVITNDGDVKTVIYPETTKK